MKDKAFEAWMERVDRVVRQWSGLSVYDLPDCDFHGMWEDGCIPLEAAEKALEEALW